MLFPVAGFEWQLKYTIGAGVIVGESRLSLLTGRTAWTWGLMLTITYVGSPDAAQVMKRYRVMELEISRVRMTKGMNETKKKTGDANTSWIWKVARGEENT